MVGLLFSEIFADKIRLEETDIKLTPGKSAGYQLSKRIRGQREFTDIWDSSDLSDLLNRMAEVACKRYRHLEKHPERTLSKMRK